MIKEKKEKKRSFLVFLYYHFFPEKAQNKNKVGIKTTFH